MASKQTEHYGLNLWEGTDKFIRAEFNEDNRRVDAAIKGVAEDCAAGLQELDGAKCRLMFGTFVGNGQAQRTIALGVTPKVVIVKNPLNSGSYNTAGEVCFAPAMAVAGVAGNTLNIVENGFTVTSHGLVNRDTTTYLYFAFV